ncbi:hypothetical protein BJP40_26935 [Streptomyces sp. CC53]|uniref:hypothetical protein n=1 Tax=Streptomyces sp. CC53 TaxID=1906740 RepID=UPI0008DE65F3|nr:hypothetical protein [Streptomyces sp. CC53]OII62875.1 hypothetical protein BJP40_26935 [Streptomyces sp. CC53]
MPITDYVSYPVYVVEVSGATDIDARMRILVDDPNGNIPSSERDTFAHRVADAALEVPGMTAVAITRYDETATALPHP